MNLVILTPGQTVYEGQVVAVNTPGTAGKIEVLENHAPIVASLGEGTISVTTVSKDILSFETTGGFMEVLKNNISILLEAVK
jgi:F-type H+-transporting ATPase subunit epsilon